MPKVYVSKAEAHHGVLAYYDLLVRHLDHTGKGGKLHLYTAEESETLKVCLRMIEKMKRAAEFGQ